MGYSWSASGGNSGPDTGGNAYIGDITVGGNPNVHAAITSVSSVLQNPITLAIAAVCLLGALWIWKRGR